MWSTTTTTTYSYPYSTTATNEDAGTTIYVDADVNTSLLEQARRVCAPAWRYGLDRKPPLATLRSPKPPKSEVVCGPFTPRRLAPKEWSGRNFKKERG